MGNFSISDAEQRRVAALEQYKLSENGRIAELDELIKKLQESLDAAIAAIDFVDADYVLVKSSVGGSFSKIARSETIADILVKERLDELMIPNVLEDSRTKNSFTALPPHHTRSIAAVALRSSDREIIGLVGVTDVVVRHFDKGEMEKIRKCANEIEKYLESRLKVLQRSSNA